MRVLVACEYSGRVREAFRAKGHEAWSCDILPAEDNSPFHYQKDVFEVLNSGWDLLVAHPPCTFLATSGARWLNHPKYPNRRADREEAKAFFLALMNAPIDKIAIENPIGYMSTCYRKPDQIIQPFWFGDKASKQTCLWLKNLPKLTPTNKVEPEWHITKNGNKYDKWWFDTCRISNLEERRKVRSKTFQGIANAMAEQWG